MEQQPERRKTSEPTVPEMREMTSQEVASTAPPEGVTESAVPSAGTLLPLPVEPLKKREGKVDITPKGEIRFYATGRRKEAIARVWVIFGGSGNVTVNDCPLWDYLHGRISLVEQVLEPFRVTNTLGMFDVKATAKGGGIAGQAEALRHGIARALVVWSEEVRPLLRRHGLLTRCARVKERKKYGHKRARRGFQFRKR